MVQLVRGLSMLLLSMLVTVPLPPKKKNGWRTALLIGCGFMLGIAAVVVVFALLMMKECNDKNQDRTTPLIKDLKVEESLVLKNKLDSNQIKELVPRGTPKALMMW